jgi:hypothetical protein
MAEDTASTTSDQQLSQIIAQLLAGKTAQTAADPNRGPSSMEGRGLLSRLGEGLAGGAQYGSTQEREQGGLAALGAMGARMLQASDWSSQPHTFGSILGQGLESARGSLGQTQAVSAAQHYAAQQLAHQQQQDQIARLREALPYLQLQQQMRGAAEAGRLLGDGGGNTSIGAAGDGTYVGAIGGHEGTGKNPNSSAVGVGQFLDSTWMDFVKANPQYFAGMTPEQALAARKDLEFGKKVGPVAIEWLAKQNADALTKAGVPASGPVLGIAHYLGAGAAANIAKAPDSAMVSSFVPAAAVAANPELKTMTVGQMKARYANTPNPSFMGASAPGQAGAPATPTPVGQNPNAKVQIPPPAAPAPGQATMPPPEPPLLTGTAQTAGDVGAPTGTVIPPSPAGSDATVAAIEEGRASSPARTGAPQPGAVVTAQAGGQQPTTQLPPIKAGDGLITHPGTYSEYRAREFVPPPPTEDFNPNLTPAQQGAFADERKGLDKRAALVRTLPYAEQPKAVGEILSARAELAAKIQLAAQEKAQKAALAVTKYNETQDNAIRPRYEKEVDAYKAAAQANLAHSQALEIEGEKGKQSRLSTAAGAEVERGKAVKEALDKDSIAASSQHQSLGGLLALSDNVDDTHTTLQSLANIKYGGTTLLNHLTNAGVVAKGDAGPIQMLQSGISGAITQLRAGIQMGALSDRDLTFIESMGPSLYEDQATRTAVIKYLQQASRAKMRFNTIYNEEITRPGTNPAEALERTRNIMDEKHPIVPQMPADLFEHRRDKDPVWMNKVAEWAQENNVKPRTLYRAPGGGLKLVPDPGKPEANNGAFR